jgi:Lhr-like helicase
MKDLIVSELIEAERLLSNWKWLPGSQIKMLMNHLITALDLIASYALEEQTMIEKAYLVLSSVKLFGDSRVEQEFYNNYFFLRNLQNKLIERINEDRVRIVGNKQVITADRGYFQELIDSTRKIVDEAFQ